MKNEDINVLIAIINSYYPTKKILDNELDMAIWRDEFLDFEKDLTIQAVRNVCRESENSYCVNIASIRNEYARLYKQREIDNRTKLEEKPKQIASYDVINKIMIEMHIKDKDGHYIV